MAADESGSAGDERRSLHIRLARHAAHRAVERREVAEAGEGERQEKAMVGGDTERRQAAVIDRLIVERNAAALRIVEAGNPLLEHAPLRHVVAERIDAAEAVVLRVDVRLRVDGLIEIRQIPKALKLRNVALLAPARIGLNAAGPV